MTKTMELRSFDAGLVTGANGFIGSRVVHNLLQRGYRNFRCFVRPSSDATNLERLIQEHDASDEVSIIRGDLLSRRDCERAAAGTDVIYHLAAGIDKSFAGAFMNSALATRNLVEAFLHSGRPRRFVNVSSFSVYSNLKLKRGALLDENCPLEDKPQRRYDAYGFGKLKQDEIVREYGRTHGLPYVIMRPGSVFGPGKKALTGRVGIDTFGVFFHVGGSNLIPLTYVDNCADAIVRAGLVPGVEAEVFNIVDDQLLTSAQLLRAYKKGIRPIRSVRLPYFVARLLSAFWEDYAHRSQGQLPPVFNRRRCAAEWKGNTYSNQKLKDRLGWQPTLPMEQAVRNFVEQRF